MSYPWNRLMMYFLRILNLAVSVYVAYEVYDFVFNRYSTYIPIKYYLDELNTQTGIGALLRENSLGFRELYIHNFEKSLLCSFIAFIVCFLSIEYIYRSSQKQKEDSKKTFHEAIGMLKERTRISEMNKSETEKGNEKVFREKMGM